MELVCPWRHKASGVFYAQNKAGPPRLRWPLEQTKERKAGYFWSSPAETKIQSLISAGVVKFG